MAPTPDGSTEPPDDRPDDLPAELEVDPADLARNPNAKVLLGIVVLVLLAAVVVGIGWR